VDFGIPASEAIFSMISAFVILSPWSGIWVDGYQVDGKGFQPSVTSTIFPMFFRASIYA
jgi:hypothetical protein